MSIALAPALAPVPAVTALRARRPPTYIELGATLYLPATRPDLLPVLNQEKHPGTRSLVVCTEDAVADQHLRLALDHLRRALEGLEPTRALRFLRPRNPEVLAELVRMPGCERVDGVVLPKTTEHNLPRYAEALALAPWLVVMPTVETDLAFSRARLGRFRSLLEALPNRVLCVRIGGNDLLQLLGLKRPKELTAYDTPLRTVIDDLIVSLKPAGFELSAPVFEHLDAPSVLERELELDLAHGLWSKTAIHPSQVHVIEGAYRVRAEHLALADRILDREAPAVFQMDGQMVEPATHRAWAERILKRAAVFGLAPAPLAGSSGQATLVFGGRT